jgi:hypothetical protein
MTTPAAPPVLVSSTPAAGSTAGPDAVRLAGVDSRVKRVAGPAALVHTASSLKANFAIIWLVVKAVGSMVHRPRRSLHRQARALRAALRNHRGDHRRREEGVAFNMVDAATGENDRATRDRIFTQGLPRPEGTAAALMRGPPTPAPARSHWATGYFRDAPSTSANLILH